MANGPSVTVTENARSQLSKFNDELQDKMLSHLQDSASVIAQQTKRNIPAEDSAVAQSIGIEARSMSSGQAHKITVGVDEANVYKLRQANAESFPDIRPEDPVDSEYLEHSYQTLKPGILREANDVVKQVTARLKR